MAYVPMEELLKNANNSMYKLVILAARRALELGSGSEKLISSDTNTKITSIALSEIQQNKINYRIKKTK